MFILVNEGNISVDLTWNVSTKKKFDDGLVSVFGTDRTDNSLAIVGWCKTGFFGH
jgi:hypothetical protein